MKYTICQQVRVVDMNDEIILETLFTHGEVQTPTPSIGASVLTRQLGLKEFQVVLDNREGKTTRYKIVDMEIDLLDERMEMRVLLEPVKLIVGQHDVGQL